MLRRPPRTTSFTKDWAAIPPATSRMSTPTPNTSSTTALPVGYKLGEYAINTVLGQGGFGVTYLANDTRLGAQVAIKEYFPQAYAARNAQHTIQPHTGIATGATDVYRWGLEQFLNEA